MKISRVYKNRPRDRRPLHLKLRLVITKPMTARVARRLLDRAVQTGNVPEGIEIRWMDWEKGKSGQAKEGTIMGADVRDALRVFYGALTQGETRFSKVKREGEA